MVAPCHVGRDSNPDYFVVPDTVELELCCLQGTSDAVSNFYVSGGPSLHIACIPPCTKTSF
jgi:hypothetical protein